VGNVDRSLLHAILVMIESRVDALVISLLIKFPLLGGLWGVVPLNWLDSKLIIWSSAA
jgi:hypothetical protein